MVVSVYVIGVLYNTPADPDAAPVPVPGWHINTTEAIPAWGAYVVTPTAPRVTFPAGVPTHFYAFPDQSTADQALADAGLLPPTEDTP